MQPGSADLTPAEGALDPEVLAGLRGRLRRQQVHVYLPRFTFTSRYLLNETLTRIGMPTAFGQAADFSGMNGTRSLVLGMVVHQAFVDVSEEGTEAAGATGVALRATAARPRDFAEFRADHPFLFAIMDRQTDALLFLGRFENPSA